ncbi:MAG: hypothetical protein P4L61_04115 [Candidatus Pacebacteria bacterium]|nr:hypothetical protein [Candidatus Paceibacterota bacterium]
MSLKFEKLNEESLQILDDMARSIYLDGQCYEFAIALHRGLGWDLVGVMTGSIVGSVIRHALVKSPDGKLWDIRGTVPVPEIGKPFDLDKVTLEYIMTEDMLRQVRPISESAINRASLFAQALWPDLPWRETTLRRKAFFFMADLEGLCRKHGIWIRAPYPAAQIVLCESCGDEKGFKLSPTLDGQYFFDRVL